MEPHPPATSSDDLDDEPSWSTYRDASHGRQPPPAWLVTANDAVDDDLGVMKTGKEADVSLLRRVSRDAAYLLAVKRYRDPQHRMFHRDAGYLEGRRPSPAEAADPFAQLRVQMALLAETGYTHGALSPYNLLVHEGRLVLIDLPQAVDVVGNPQGFAYLRRDCENVCGWFAARGIHADAGDLVDELTRAMPGGAG